jgi:hypothetical protein
MSLTHIAPSFYADPSPLAMIFKQSTFVNMVRFYGFKQGS